MSQKFTRRSFLKSAAAVAAPLVVPSHVLGRGGFAPSDRIRVGIVGTGGRGFQLLRDFLPLSECDLVAVCDVHRRHHRDLAWGQGPALGLEPAQQLVDQSNSARTKSGTANRCFATPDFRELCGRDDIDAVIVATPDHWHAYVALEAIRNGKDVYCEKPVTHTFAEGQALIAAAAQKGAVVQVGSQQRSESSFRRAVEIIRNGHLGTISRVEVGLPPGYAEPQGDPTVTAPPPGLDYDLWCGPAPELPYMRARHHRWWRGHRAYGGGVLMDWIGHHNDIAHWALGLERSGPVSVEAVDWVFPETSVYNSPAQYTIRSRYPDHIEIIISSLFPVGTKWIGDQGWLYATRGKNTASNAEWLQADFDVGDWRLPPAPASHASNFLACMRSREECTAPVDIAHRSITPGHLAYVSQALGKPIRWDAASETIVGDNEAQSLLRSQEIRSPWKLPADEQAG